MSDALEGILRRLAKLEDAYEQTRPKETLTYATGTWQPTYVGGTTAGATGYAVQVGEYTRIGRMVFGQGRVVWTSATGTGVARISLPFAASSITNAYGAVALVTDNVTFAGTAPEGLIIPGAAYFELKYPVSNANAVDIAVEAAGTVFFQVSYII